MGLELYKGVPEAVGIEYLQTEGKKVNLDKADKKLLKELSSPGISFSFYLTRVITLVTIFFFSIRYFSIWDIKMLEPMLQKFFCA